MIGRGTELTITCINGVTVPVVSEVRDGAVRSDRRITDPLGSAFCEQLWESLTECAPDFDCANGRLRMIRTGASRTDHRSGGDAVLGVWNFTQGPLGLNPTPSDRTRAPAR